MLKYTKILAEECSQIHKDDDSVALDVIPHDFTVSTLACYIAMCMNLKNTQYSFNQN